jgi:hypothetical protein
LGGCDVFAIFLLFALSLNDFLLIIEVLCLYFFYNLSLYMLLDLFGWV